jgi:hypothetical protein
MDEKAKSPEIFDAAKYPTAIYSGKFSKFNGATPTEAQGTLTMHGVTKPVTLVINSFMCKPNPMTKKEVCGADAAASFDRGDFAGAIKFVAAEIQIWGSKFLGLFTLAGYARSCGRNLSIAKIRRHHFCERSGTPCVREICFSRTGEIMVAQTTGSWCCFNVGVRFDDFRGFAVQCRWRFGC